jgi:hypothetical protein
MTEKLPEPTTCDGCSFVEFEGECLPYRVQCTRISKEIPKYPDIPPWCPLPGVMTSAELLLSTLVDYLDIAQEELFANIEMLEEQGEKLTEGWMIADQRLYELDNVYEFIDRVKQINIQRGAEP